MKYIIAFLMFFVSADISYSAYISSHKGWVEIKKASSGEWSRVSDEGRINLAEGDEMRTRRASMAELYMDDGSKISIAPMSFFKVSKENKEISSLGLFAGRIRSWVRKFSKKFEVRTPAAVCAVRGTDFVVSADETGNTRVEVYEGSVVAGDASGRTSLIREGELIDISRDVPMGSPQVNPNPPASMESAVTDSRTLAKMEIYNEISKEDVIKSAQAEIQSAEYQNRKVAIDAFGKRVRMEEYVVRPAADQFKYVVLNTRESRFDFGKILFTFNNALPEDLTLATRNMISASGTAAPQWYLTDMNSVMSNTKDKVTEDASGGHMVPDNALNPTEWNIFFTNYAFYAQGGDMPVENGGMGKMMWSYTDINADNTMQSGELTYLGGSAPAVLKTNPSGDDVFHDTNKNTYSDSDGTWIQVEDWALFDNGKTVSTDDLASKLGATKDEMTDRLNFERVYTSSLFNGRTINLEFSAKLLKDAGLLRFE